MGAGKDTLVKAKAKTVKKVSLPNAKPLTFEEWFKSVPPGVPRNEADGIKMSVEIHMKSWCWFNLLQGASRNGWTIGEAIEELLVEGIDGGVCEWGNCDYQTAKERKAERDEILKLRIDCEKQAAKGKAKR